MFDVPYLNANCQVSSGIDTQVTANVRLRDDVRFISRVDVTRVLRLDRFKNTSNSRCAV